MSTRRADHIGNATGTSIEQVEEATDILTGWIGI